MTSVGFPERDETTVLWQHRVDSIVQQIFVLHLSHICIIIMSVMQTGEIQDITAALVVFLS